jgi:hypothetical protein
MAENSPPCVGYADFARGRPTRVVGRGATDADRALAVQRTLSRVGERGYSLIGGNCEHFATWCATGVAASQQVVDWISAETGAEYLVSLEELIGCPPEPQRSWAPTEP